jgi:hypothetical protein
VAIKGKSRSRGTKGVTRGPKPAYVPVKTPLLRRRGLWVGVGVLLGLAAIAGITYGFVQERSRDREEAQQLRMATAVDDYGAAVEPMLTTVGQPLPPTSFDAFPELSTLFEALQAEDVSADTLEAAGSTADAVAGSARAAAGELENLSATDLVAGRDLPADFVASVVDSHDDFLLSMDLYRQVGLLLSMAAETEDAAVRGDLVTRAEGVHDGAERAFARAYARYLEAQISAGTFTPSAVGATGTTG